MNPNDPAEGPRGEETADWPAGQQRPAGEPPSDPETTVATPASPRSIHEETTLDAAQFLRPQQPPPGAPPPPPGWPGQPAGHQQPPAPGPGGPPPYQHPGTWPAGYQQPPPTVVPRAKPSLGSRLSEHRWWVIGAAAAIAVVLVIALIVASSGDDSSSEDGPPTSPAQVPAGPKTTVPASPTAAPPSQPPAAPPAPNVAPDALPGLLLPAEQINQRMNTSGMTALPTEHAPLGGTVTPPHCTGVWAPAYQATYDGSGYTGLAIQGVHREPSHKVAQAVVSFPDAGRAKAFYDKQVADWNACKSSHVRWEYGGNSTELDVGVPAITAGVMTVMLFPTNSPTAGQQCERDMTVRGNVIVDVRACSPTVGSAGLSIATAIADKVAPAP